MRIGRTIPPASSPIYIRDLLNGLKGLRKRKREIDLLRSDLKAYFDVKHCYFVSSGKAALTIILKALHDLHPERDEVLIPAFICFSVPSAIVRAGLKVKLCDLDDRTLDFDHVQLEKILNTNQSEKSPQIPNRKKLLAVIPAHLFGLAADVDRVKRLVKYRETAVVEDAAQVFGAALNGKRLGTLGDVGFLSLGRGKALSAVEGGVILTNRKDLADGIEKRLSEVADYTLFEIIKLIIDAVALFLFQNPMLFWFPKLLPFLKIGDTFYDPDFKIRRFSAFQAGLLKDWKKKITVFKRRRLANTETVLKFLRKDTIIKGSITHFIDSRSQAYANEQGPNGAAAIRNQKFPFIRFPVLIHNAELWNTIVEESVRNGLGITHTYPSAVNYIVELRDKFNDQSYTIAEGLPHQILTIPVHPYVSKYDFLNISMILKKLVEKHGHKIMVEN